MNTEEPQNESAFIEQVTSEHILTEGQNQAYSADHDSADSEEENVVLFDTQSSQPDILKTYASVHRDRV